MTEKTFKTKAFARWSKGERISDATLKKAVEEMRNGLIEARLGSGLCKKRVPASSRGKRGGARTLVAFQNDQNTFFIYGFLKNEAENIDRKELKALKTYATVLLALDDKQISQLLSSTELIEIR